MNPVFLTLSFHSLLSLSQTPKNMSALLLVVKSGLSLQQLVELVYVLILILRKRKKLKRISLSQSIKIGKAFRDWGKNGHICFAFLPQPGIG